MILSILLWVLFVILISIIPVMVITYRLKLRYKQKEITSILSGSLGDKYLHAYYPELAIKEKDLVESHISSPGIGVREIIREFFKNEYGNWNFFLPVVTLLFITSITLFLFISGKHQLIGLSSGEISFINKIPEIIYFGFLGAFISGLMATYKRHNRMDLTPSFLYSVNSKILLCSVLGYLFSFIFVDKMAIFASFGAGFFSLPFLEKYVRRLAFRKLDKKELMERTSDLGRLQGLNEAIVERLEEIDITTCQSLAYSDPIKLLFRTNFQLKIILDWIDQALLYNYIGEKIKQIRSIGIRGIIELASLYEPVEEFDGSIVDKAELLSKVAGRIEADPKELSNFIYNLYEDPHVEFIWDLFGQSSNDED